MTPTRGALAVAFAYLGIATALSGVRPLWLDEILQLIHTRQPSANELMVQLPLDTGAVPLGYIVQHASMKVTGFSLRRARLPAAVFGAATVLVVALLGTELGLKSPLLAAIAFGGLPLMLRYATEARIYSQGLFFSALATLIYVRLANRPSWAGASVYAAVLLAAIYSQPYAVSVGLAHLLWSVLHREWRVALLGAAAIAVVAFAFLPWFLWSKAQWTRNINLAAQHFSVSTKTPLVILRELAGAGYVGTGALLILSGLAIAGRRFASRTRSVLILLLAMPLVIPLAADAWFDYFIAARQFIWCLPAAAILAAGACERRKTVTKTVTTTLAGLLGVACLWSSFRFFTGPHEDWEAAATALAGQVQRGACLVVAPSDQARLYEFFRPELRDAHCSGPRVVLASSPYTTREERRATIARLLPAGYARESEVSIGKCAIELFEAHPKSVEARQ